MRILITDGNERVALAVARSLTRAGHAVVVTAPTRLSLAGVSRGIRPRALSPDPLAEPAQYAAAVGRIARDEDVAMVLPMTDASVEAVLEYRHALPPNLGQGGGCAIMNAMSLAVYLDRHADIPAALAAWEKTERPLTDHTQRISYWLGLPTTWPPRLRALTFALIGRSKWLVRQRSRTALHRPTGT